MTITTVAGPFTEDEAKETAKSLGAQFSIYGVHRKDNEGYTLDECDYWVEKDDTILADKIFGYAIDEFMAKQYK